MDSASRPPKGVAGAQGGGLEPFPTGAESSRELSKVRPLAALGQSVTSAVCDQHLLGAYLYRTAALAGPWGATGNKTPEGEHAVTSPGKGLEKMRPRDLQQALRRELEPGHLFAFSGGLPSTLGMCVKWAWAPLLLGQEGGLGVALELAHYEFPRQLIPVPLFETCSTRPSWCPWGCHVTRPTTLLSLLLGATAPAELGGGGFADAELSEFPSLRGPRETWSWF